MQTPHPRSNLLLFVMSRVRIRSIERGTFVLFSKDPRQKDKYERMEANHFVVDFPPGKKKMTATTLKRCCFDSTTFDQVWECLVRFDDPKKLILITSEKYDFS